MSKRELIARLYFIMSVETGTPFKLYDLPTVLESNLNISEFEVWLVEQNCGDIFNQWLEENELLEIWNSSEL